MLHKLCNSIVLQKSNGLVFVLLRADASLRTTITRHSAASSGQITNGGGGDIFEPPKPLFSFSLSARSPLKRPRGVSSGPLTGSARLASLSGSRPIKRSETEFPAAALAERPQLPAGMWPGERYAPLCPASLRVPDTSLVTCQLERCDAPSWLPTHPQFVIKQFQA